MAGGAGWGGDGFRLVIVVEALAAAVASSGCPSACLGVAACRGYPCGRTRKSKMQNQQSDRLSLRSIGVCQKKELLPPCRREKKPFRTLWSFAIKTVSRTTTNHYASNDPKLQQQNVFLSAKETF